MVPGRPQRMLSWFACLAMPLLLLSPSVGNAQDAATSDPAGASAEAPPADAPPADTPAKAPAADAPSADAPATDTPAAEVPAEAPPAEAPPADAAPSATAPAEQPTAASAAADDDEGGFEDESGDDGAEEFSDEDLGGFEEEGSDEPALGERRLVAYVATGVAVAALVTGGVFAFLAWQQHQCVADVVECNKTLDDPIVGEELFDARAEIEYKALAADMAFLFGGAAALVAGTGYVRGFLFTGEDDGKAIEDEPVTLRGLPPLPRVAQEGATPVKTLKSPGLGTNLGNSAQGSMR